MGEDPARAIREKKSASVTVAARLVADGEAMGMVSAGSTGAAMAAAALVIGRLKGVQRPAIAIIMPNHDGGIVILDAGANIECRPEHLAQFGVMGSALAEAYLGLVLPRVGLLNIGEEEGKGRELDKAAFGLLARAPIEFIGNVEGRDLSTGKADVIVTDGFTGNVLLKTSEGAASVIAGMVGEVMLADDDMAELLPVLLPKFEDLKKRVDPDSYGGAHLLGSRGVVVIAHGASSRVAIARSLEKAAEGVNRGLVSKVAAGLGG
jgi:glycerol-3-phosphate acyltransferase PlsX